MTSMRDIFFARCCFCIPLKAGVVIISSIWLIYGVAQFIRYVYYCLTDDGSNVYTTFKPFALILAVIYGLIAVGSLYGLSIVTYNNNWKNLARYFRVAFSIAMADIMMNVILIFIIVLSKRTFMNECIKVDRIHEITCKSSYDDTFLFNLVSLILVMFVPVYFTKIISEYTVKRYKKESGKRNDPNKSDVADESGGHPNDSSKSDESDGPSNSNKLDESSSPSNSNNHDESGGTSNFSKLGESSSTSDSNKLDESGDPSNSSKSDESGGPSDSGKPSGSGGSGDSANEIEVIHDT